jgi:hypothetical protein
MLEDKHDTINQRKLTQMIKGFLSIKSCDRAKKKIRENTLI